MGRALGETLQETGCGLGLGDCGVDRIVELWNCGCSPVLFTKDTAGLDKLQIKLKHHRIVSGS